MDTTQPRPRPAYVDVRVEGRLLFRYDPYREIVQIRTHGKTHTVDLLELRQEQVIEDKGVNDGHE